MSGSSDIRQLPYESPHAKWVCGNTDCGSPCAIGPTALGHCPELHPCAPRQDGNTWKCTRSKLQGGPCDGGPQSDGTCGLPRARCAPQPSLRTTRGSFVFISAAALLGAFALALSSPKRNELIVPGGLTTPHAQILREQGTDRCATCHEHGHGSFADWVLAGIGNFVSELSSRREPPTGPSQSSLCMECHKKSIDAGSAQNPHTAERTMLSAMTTAAGGSATEPSSVACAACHQEHHGANHDLTRMTTAQCNHCHANPFTGFAEGHPEFKDWPYQRRAKIAFTHASHQSRHFPTAGTEFSCQSCHETQSGQITSTISFEVGCSGCHDQKIRQSFADGFELVRLPMLDVELLEDNALGVGEWPQSATGDFDGGFPPLMILLLKADPTTAAWFEKFRGDFDFMDLDPDDLEDLEIASDLIWAYKLLLRDLAAGDLETIRGRLASVFTSSEPTDSTAIQTEDRVSSPFGELTADQRAIVEALVSQLPLNEIKRAQEAWLPNLFEEILTEQSVFLPAKMAADVSPSKMTSQQVGQPAWATPLHETVRDDGFCRLAIVPQGHSSPLIRAWLDTLVSTQGRWSDGDQLLAGLQSQGDACLSCHTVDQGPLGGLSVNWRSVGETKSFTRFDHGPHLTLPELQDCNRCHQLSGQQNAEVYQGFDCTQNDGSFLPISKSTCVVCHNAKTTTDHCMTCHNYHVGGGMGHVGGVGPSGAWGHLKVILPSLRANRLAARRELQLTRTRFDRCHAA